MDNVREMLLEIIKTAGYETTSYNSRGKPVCTYSSPFVAEDLVEPFTDYLLANGVTVQELPKEVDHGTD